VGFLGGTGLDSGVRSGRSIFGNPNPNPDPLLLGDFGEELLLFECFPLTLWELKEPDMC
jgi:hypothetical protein